MKLGEALALLAGLGVLGGGVAFWYHHKHKTPAKPPPGPTHNQQSQLVHTDHRTISQKAAAASAATGGTGILGALGQVGKVAQGVANTAAGVEKTAENLNNAFSALSSLAN